MKKFQLVIESLAFGVLFFVSTTVLFAQAPGWSRGQQDLAISYDECVIRAATALQAESYRQDYAAGSFAVGIKGVHTAVISCIPLAATKVVSQVVVASNGEGGGSERECLQAQMANPGSKSSCTAASEVAGGACGLGVKWNVMEQGWNGVWTRRGNSNVFDVYQTKEGLQPLTSVETITISGNRVSVIRTNASDGNDCEMEGTIAADGITVTGTYRCKSGCCYNWQATIQCQ